jgi:dGTPase
MLKPADLPQHLRDVLGDRSSQRINAMVGDLVYTTLASNDGRLHLSDRMNDTITELRTFLYDNVYRNCRVHNEFEKAQRIIRDLYGFFLQHEFPENSVASCLLRHPVQSVQQEQQRHRQVCDFIAGMTDRYALALYAQIFMPKPWSVF